LRNEKVNFKNKKVISTIAIILMLTFSAIIIALPINAQVASLFTASVQDRGIINVSFPISFNSPEDLEFAYTGIKLLVKAPGSANFVEQAQAYTADEDGNLQVDYTATTAGTYEFKFKLPAPQGDLEANPSSGDGSYETNIATIEVVTEYTNETYAFVNAMPNKLGVGEETLLHFGITNPTFWPQRGWEGLTVEVEKPNGDTETLGPFMTDLTGGAGSIYVPDQVGIYRIRTHFPQQQAETETMGFPPGTTFLESYSAWFEIEVTAEPGLHYPDTPLPQEYWSRPIDAQFRTWYVIGGDYLSGGRGSLGFVQPTAENPDFVRSVEENLMAPETGHILWAKPLLSAAISPLGGGLTGGWGTAGQHAYEDGDAYEGFFTPPVIMGGVVYYNDAKSSGRDVEQNVVAVDIRTGEKLWTRNWDNRRLDFGQSFFYTGFNYHGVFQYLWETTGGTWNAYEAATGRWVYGMTNVPRGEMMFGPNGEIIIYTINLEDGWISKWNSRWVIDGLRWMDTPDGPDSGFGSWLRFYMGDTIDARIGIEWNVTLPIPDDLSGGNPRLQRIRNPMNDTTYMVFTNFDRGSPTPHTAEMWMVTFDPGNSPAFEPIEWVDTSYARPDQEMHPGQVPRKVFDPKVTLEWSTFVELPKDKAILNVEDVSVQDDLIEIIWSENPSVWGYRLSSGEKLWGPWGPHHYQNHWSYESSNSWDLIYQGKVLVGGHGGTIYALNTETGESIWNFTAPDPYNEYLFNNYWRLRIELITDGKLYIHHSEHSPFDPKPRGAQLYCVDLGSGELIWSINLRGTEWGDRIAIGDNILVTSNTFDSRVYSLGKGPSETTVSIQDDVVAEGETVLIKGYVTDISAGTQDYAIAARFPKGVAAVSDDSMSAWMEYVYLQKERPMDITGVEVSIDAFDSSGTLIHLGEATSDASGLFSYAWTPDTQDQYNVAATFMGSAGYWPSSDQAPIVVGPTPSQGGPIQPEAPAGITTEVAIIAAIIVIAAIAIVAYVVLRRR
jgi:outer membrane protein assembly factor BamB